MRITPSLLYIITLFLLIMDAQAQVADHVVISEFATRGASGNQAGEFVEIYNPTGETVDISGWELQYQSASGSAYSRLARIPDGTEMRPRSFYLITGSSWNGTPAADVTWPSSGMADNGNIRITDDSGRPIDRVGYGSGNNPEGSAAPNHGTSANDNSVERKASATSTAATLSTGGTEEFAGNGWDGNDNGADFIEQTNGRNPQNSASAAEPPSADGSGTATTSVQQAGAGDTLDLPIEFTPSAQFTISAMKIVIPSGFLWSGNAADVTLDSRIQAEVSVDADTVHLDRLTFSDVSATITVENLVAASSTGSYPFVILTSGGESFLPIQNPPAVFVRGGPIPIAEARENDANGVPVHLGEIVTVNGIVTVADQFGAPGYIQDHTGGIAIYDFDFTESVSIGDEVTLTGEITHFNGLTELESVTIESIPSTGNTVTPEVVSIEALLNDGQGGDERYESELVRLNNVTVNTSAWTVSGSGTNYKLSDGTFEIDVRIDNDVPFAGDPAPGGSFDIVGVLSQYKRDAPFAGGYQLMPRLGSDVIATGPRIIDGPNVTDIQSDAVTLSWSTGEEAEGFVRYGETAAFELGVAESDETAGGRENSALISGLDPATIYRVQAYSVANADTSFSQPMYVSTSSLNSTGDINVYFNQEVDNSIAGGVEAQGDVLIANRLMDRIDAAQYSIDLCFYSLSGRPGDDIAERLLAARDRGVRIRAIFETDNANTNAMRTLRNNVPAIVDNFDRTNAGAGLMHNKFVIIDARDRSSDRDDWIIMGSWNPTEPGTFDDAQNVVEIQDQALANAYTREFEEMWGSSTDTPNSAVSRFGARKLDNTPHLFFIGQDEPRIPMELYFSPSDQVSARLVRAVNDAGTSLYFATLTFTRDDIARALVDRHDEGIPVRGIMDNRTDQGSEFDYLQSSGVDVFLKKGLSGFLHHKYLIVDAESPVADAPHVITGSHNWSNAAEFSNNENTLVIHDRAIAEQYLQEWYTRYVDAGGTGVIVLDVEDVTTVPVGFDVVVYPNPMTRGGTVAVEMDEATSLTEIRVLDLLGRVRLSRSLSDSSAPSQTLRLEASALEPGTYVLQLQRRGGSVQFARFVIVPAH